MRYPKLIRRHHVQSEAVRSIGYDESEWVLQVEFHGGKVYNYFRVPPREHEALRTAGSIGEYLNREIKHYYEYELFEAEESWS